MDVFHTDLLQVSQPQLEDLLLLMILGQSQPGTGKQQPHLRVRVCVCQT